MLNPFERRYDGQIMDPYSNIGQTRVQCNNLTVSVYLEEFGNSVCVCVCVVQCPVPARYHIYESFAKRLVDGIIDN